MTKTRETDPSDIRFCTGANLRKASRVITQAFDGALQPVGLKSTQFTLLATLSKSGEQPLTQLAEVLVMDRTTLTRNLKPLLVKGLVEDRPGNDRRVRKIALTEAGRTALERAMPLWQAAQRRLVKSLGANRWSGLINDLSAVVANNKQG